MALNASKSAFLLKLNNEENKKFCFLVSKYKVNKTHLIKNLIMEAYKREKLKTVKKSKTLKIPSANLGLPKNISKKEIYNSYLEQKL